MSVPNGNTPTVLFSVNSCLTKILVFLFLNRIISIGALANDF
jgi:hypothetical protein